MDTTESSATSSKNVNRRRSSVVNPAFQWKYAALIGGSVFFVATFICVVMFGVMHHQARERVINPAGAFIDLYILIIAIALLGLSGG